MRKILAFLIALYQKTLSPDHPTSPHSGLRRASGPIIALINVYQCTLSPDHGPCKFLYPYGFCRHTPTCSEYAKQTLLEKGVLRGVPHIVKRLLTCTPWTPLSERKLQEIISAPAAKPQ